MRTRPILITAAAAVVLAVATPAAAQAGAKSVEQIDRRLFDATPERTAAAWHLEGLTAGPLGGAMDVTFTAPDGTLPTTFGSCEPVDVDAVVTLSPGEILTLRTEGEACAHIVSGTLQINAFFDKDNVTYTGIAHRKAKVLGDGLIAAADQSFGGLANFSAAISWKD